MINFLKINTKLIKYDVKNQTIETAKSAQFHNRLIKLIFLCFLISIDDTYLQLFIRAKESSASFSNTH